MTEKKKKADFATSISSDGIVTAYVNGSRYKYTMDPARYVVLYNKFRTAKGKLFNAIKAEGALADDAKILPRNQV